MLVDVYLIILIIVLFVIVIVVFWWIRQHQPSEPPVILLDASGRDEFQHECGGKGTIYSNMSGRPMTVNVDVAVNRDGNCAVTFSTKALGDFLEVPILLPRRGAAAIPLAHDDAITFACHSDESGSECRFSIKLTRI